MIHNSIYRKGFVLLPVILGAAVVVVSAVVLFFGVQRVKDLQTVLQRPKAAGTITWPACVQDQSKAYWCTNDDCFNSSDDRRNINKCCDKVKGDPQACAWPARGWCKPPPEQCPDSGGQMCGLYFFNSGSGCYGYNSGGGGGSCIPTSLTPADGATNISATQTFSWSLPQAPSSYVNAYLWSCAAKTENCGVFGAVASPYTSIPVTSFYRDSRFGANFEAGSWNGNNVASLNPNKQYWWTINVDGNPSCSSAASFTTGTGGTTSKTCSISLDKTSITTGQTVTVTSSGTGGTMSTYVSRTDSEVLVNFGNSVYTDSQGHNYYKFTGNSLSGLTAGDYKIWCDINQDPGKCSGNPFCPYKGGSLPPPACTGWVSCSSADNASLTVTAVSTNPCSGKTDGVACTITNCPICNPGDEVCSKRPCRDVDGVCLSQSCVDKTQAHVSCGASTCKWVSGGGANTDGCTTAGASCTVWACQKDPDCADDKKCSSNKCVTPVCSPDPGVCQTAEYKNHACKAVSKADGTACGATGSGNTCQNGVCTVPVECDTDSKCLDDKKCNLTTNKCVTPVCSPEPGVCQTAEYKNHACSLKNKADGTACETNKVCSAGVCVASEVNACWDNKGVNGKCYDCNGDGTINILDFSCFQKHWLKNVE